MAEEWCHYARKLANAKVLSCAEIEKTLGAIKQEQHELTKKFKEVESGHKSAEASLKNAEKQAKDHH